MTAVSTKVHKEILSATKLERRTTEDDQTYLKRLVRAIEPLSDEQWEALSSDAQDWFNGSVDAMRDKKALELFEDMAAVEAAAEAAAPTSRRRAAPVESKDDTADVVGEDHSFSEGDLVRLVDAKDNEYVGKIVELTDTSVTLDVDGEEDIFRRSKVKSMLLEAPAKPAAKAARVEDAPVDGKPAKPAKPVAKESDAADAPAADAPKMKKARTGVTSSIREAICSNFKRTKEEIAAQLRTDGIEFAEGTLDLMYSDIQRTIETLRVHGHMK